MHYFIDLKVLLVHITCWGNFNRLINEDWFRLMALPLVASIWDYLWEEREKKKQSVCTKRDKRDWITTWQNWAVLLKYGKNIKENQST